MVTFISVATHFFIQAPTGDVDMPWITIGPAFTTEAAARNALIGYRPELQQECKVAAHTYETFTAHAA